METDDYIVERNAVVLHVAPNVSSLLAWVQAWAEQSRHVRALSTRLESEYGALQHLAWVDVLVPYAGLQDWEYVLSLFREAYDRVRQVLRERTVDAVTPDSVRETTANWFRDVGHRLAHEMFLPDRAEFESKWRDELNLFTGMMRHLHL